VLLLDVLVEDQKEVVEHQWLNFECLVMVAEVDIHLVGEKEEEHHLEQEDIQLVEEHHLELKEVDSYLVGEKEEHYLVQEVGIQLGHHLEQEDIQVEEHRLVQEVDMDREDIHLDN